MSFLAPLSLALGAAVAVAVVVLHLLTTRRPPPVVLPTARFVPPGEARAVARSKRPTDVPLMLLRMLAALLVGAAFARPVMDAAGPSVRTVVLLERSRAVADAPAAAAIAREQVGEGGAIVVFGDSAREVMGDSLDAARPAANAGSLSAAFVAARGAAARIAPGADSLRLVVVSPLVAGSVDAATATLRAGWPGRIELRRVAAVSDTARGATAELLTPLDDDPLAPAMQRLGAVRGAHAVRVQRGAWRAADSAWAADGAGRVLIAWPARFEGAPAPLGVTAFGSPRAADDAPVRTLVAPLARMPLGEPGAGDRVIARWNDGSPAALQRGIGEGCVRMVGVGVPLAGDLTLREPFMGFLEALAEPCEGLVGEPLDESMLGWLGSDDGTPLAPARSLAAADDARTSRLPALLLAAALLLLAAEQLLRRRAVTKA